MEPMRFKDLSPALKIAVIGGWGYVVVFIVGLIFGLLTNL